MAEKMSWSTSVANCFTALARLAGGDVDGLELVLVELHRDDRDGRIRVVGIAAGELAGLRRSADHRHAHGVELVRRLRGKVGGEGAQRQQSGHPRLESALCDL